MKNGKIILLVIGLIVLVTGTTYAIYTWRGKSFIKGEFECFDVNYTKGREIGSNENKATLELGSSALDGLSSTMEVSLNDKCSITVGSGTLYLDVDSTTSDILITSGILKYQVVHGNSFISEGVVSVKGRNIVAEDIKITDNVMPITVVVWLDSDIVNDSNKEAILSSTFSGKINIKVESRRA